VGRRPGPAGGSGCPSANYRAVSVSSVSAERAGAIVFLILSYLDLKIVGDLKRDQGLILPYAILPALFCPTIIVQALKRGFDGNPAYYGASWYCGSSEQSAWELVELSSRGRTRGDHAAGLTEILYSSWRRRARRRTPRGGWPLPVRRTQLYRRRNLSSERGY
jgi:hypothetical protein